MENVQGFAMKWTRYTSKISQEDDIRRVLHLHEHCQWRPSWFVDGMVAEDKRNGDARREEKALE